MIKEQMEEIYRSIAPEEIPWNMETPPDLLRALVEGERIRPCKAIEFGCGTGNYVMYLAGKGFDATGVDISEAAIKIAKRSALEKKRTCRFLVSDVLGDMKEIRETFDFAYDWELLHHIFPPDREKYVGNVFRLLPPQGIYLSVSFSEKSARFGGTGKYRKTPLGTVLYFSSEAEMISLFEPRFVLEELRTVDIPGKSALHTAIYALMSKRE